MVLLRLEFLNRDRSAGEIYTFFTLFLVKEENLLFICDRDIELTE
jgi:hypothetical protein